MKIFLSNNSLCLFALLLVCCLVQSQAAVTRQFLTCTNKNNRKCFLKKVQCPMECPLIIAKNPTAKSCFLNCNNPTCETECRHRIPNCNSNGAACFDPRFIGGDGRVFYFHGKRDEHFSLVSDQNLQINARFIGLRPAGRPRDFTWIQALGVLFDSHSFSFEATRAATWDDDVDHLKFSYDGNEIYLPEGPLSIWDSPEKDIKVERILSKNSIIVSIKDIAEISARVVPVTKEDDRIHNYQIPSDDCFAHLEVQFRFFGLSPKVNGVLGRTYQPDFEYPKGPTATIPVVGGEDRYRTMSLLSPECQACVFSPNEIKEKESSLAAGYGTEMLDCGSGLSNGNGIVCKK